MKITEKKITIREVTDGYINDAEEGVTAFDDNLDIRPKYQREFVYDDKKRNEVIRTIMKGLPLNVMYWVDRGKAFDNDDIPRYEVLDGQQRTISVCEYVDGSFSVDDKLFDNLPKDIQDKILNYELTVYICEGTESEKLEWFKIINIAGEQLTEQELRNAVYAGSWVSDAKTYFSKRNCVAGQMADGYIKGNPIRQEYLEKVLLWIADRDNLESGQMYMAVHQHDADANDLWLYFQTVINWAKMLFKVCKGITDVQNWGLLYNKYHNKQYNSNILEADVQNLIKDDDVTKKSGIIPYVLSDRTKHDERNLSIRVFTESQKHRAYERQEHKCPCCVKNGIDTEYAYNEMQGDHIIPWSQGGRTIDSNLQMLCQKCNNDKSNQ